ncbi:MAG: molybdenum cofactor guanylyltransferase [Niameybacter sp.]|uniref:molybdenum cofactor guanylyltransferase n=1 Tax=Niameybacter sp. TaxID=2033640 RepID=UPI002FC7D7F1
MKLIDNPIAMLLLMGGKSSRMGQNKAWLTYKGVPFWEGLVEELKSCGPVYLSVDCKANKPCEDYPVLIDAYREIGPLGGIYTALSQIPEPYLFVCACDMPHVDRSFIQKLMSYVDERWEGVMVQDRQGRAYATAGIYSKKMLPLMKKMIEEKNYRLQYLLRQSHVCYVTLEEMGMAENVVMNVNTPEEYTKLKGDSL